MIEVKNIKKSYGTLQVLKGIDLIIPEKQIVTIVGASGAGKSTLLHIIGTLDYPDEGEVWYEQDNVAHYSANKLANFRNNNIGFVFQFYNLIPNLTALENVELATQIGKDPADPATVLEEVGLGDRKNNFPAQLSGGEQQRVAIARALAKNPKLLLCDEPTGALDYNTGKLILKLLQDTCRKNNMTVVIVTHNQALCPMADRVVHVKSGEIQKVELNAEPMSIDDIEW